MWSKLGRVLTSLQVDSSPQGDDLESSLPLPEDNLLDGFTPLQEFQRYVKGKCVECRVCVTQGWADLHSSHIPDYVLEIRMAVRFCPGVGGGGGGRVVSRNQPRPNFHGDWSRVFSSPNLARQETALT